MPRESGTLQSPRGKHLHRSSRLGSSSPVRPNPGRLVSPLSASQVSHQRPGNPHPIPSAMQKFQGEGTPLPGSHRVARPQLRCNKPSQRCVVQGGDHRSSPSPPSTNEGDNRQQPAGYRNPRQTSAPAGVLGEGHTPYWCLSQHQAAATASQSARAILRVAKIPAAARLHRFSVVGDYRPPQVSHRRHWEGQNIQGLLRIQ
ncbi:hypothetical protein NDU88_000320 [Pleurodeles waltl]|uniref:Uncharacterized protein n=1 Tax=Pleurodeles waltl TaxID=8319 RepID=A0AAV7S964_PLEWA|nr:hypothetical protein NDU88_000320 [Pleurodeles waltl]